MVEVKGVVDVVVKLEMVMLRMVLLVVWEGGRVFGKKVYQF